MKNIPSEDRRGDIPLHPSFLRNMSEMLGSEISAFVSALSEPPALALRLNPLHAASSACAAPYRDSAVPWANHACYLKPDTRPGSAIFHDMGAYYLQEASAMAPAMALAPRRGERVLDVCAAPGGKSGQLAAELAGSGCLVCNEPDANRAKILAGNLERMGCNAMVINGYPDALAHSFPQFFDAVLVDAPCSGEGMFRREPDSRAQWNPAAPEGCARRQLEILHSAAQTVRPGGRLVYSTCTYNAVEDEGIAENFLREHPDFSRDDFSLDGLGSSKDGMLRVLPHRVRGDGQFMAKFIRRGNASIAPPARCNAPDGALEGFLGDLLLSVDFLRECALMPLGTRYCAVPRCLPVPQRLKIITPGLWLARMEKNRLEPEHALAMALPDGAARRCAKLSYEDAVRFLAGEAIAYDGERGWTLVSHCGLPLGWGKAVDGVLKNHLPKGLRRKIHTEP